MQIYSNMHRPTGPN